MGSGDTSEHGGRVGRDGGGVHWGGVGGDHWGSDTVTHQLTGGYWRDVGGDAIDLSGGHLSGVDCGPGVVLGGVDGAALELSGLVVHGAYVVGHLDVGVDGGSLDVARVDGQGHGGGGVRQGSSVSEEPTGVGRGQQRAGGRGCGAGEDGGGYNLWRNDSFIIL